MPEKPLLIFPSATVTGRKKLAGGGSKIIPPTPAQQAQRLRAKLSGIVSSFRHIAPDMDGLEPERVIVLEAAGSITDVARAAQQIAGLEWLAEVDLEAAEPDQHFKIEGEPEKPIPRRLFALMSNQHAMRNLVSLWSQWQREPEQRAQRNFGPLKQLFIYLRDIRFWEAQDRILETNIEEYWRELIQLRQDPIRFEAELWYRQSTVTRRRALESLTAIVQSAGGRRVSEFAVGEILYHGVLLELPAAEVRRIAEQLTQQAYTQLLRCEHVMFFRPWGQTTCPISGGEAELGRLATREKPSGDERPIVALLDGLPLENHEALAGRLIIDDPDGISSFYTSPRQQEHGTAMASAICHGDLSAPTQPLSRKIYVRPIMHPQPAVNGFAERIPQDRLLLDLIYRAVFRLMEGESGQPPVGRDIKIVNLSIGNEWQPFDRWISPLAKLLDWLSWKYRLLFLVSAGNQRQDIIMQVARNGYEALSDDDAVSHAVRAVVNDQVRRRLLSPAESVNAVTIGACHADGAGTFPMGQRFDLMRGRRLASPISTCAAGFRRSVKPDILMPGGRQLYGDSHQTTANGSCRVSLAVGKQAPGQRVAAPGSIQGDITRYWYERGTSIATANASRTAALIHDRLIRLRGEPGGDQITADFLSAMIKALLVHGALWGAAGEELRRMFSTETGATIRSIRTRLLGYGEMSPARSLAGEDSRVLAIACNELADGEGHEYLFPLPPSLSGRRVKRRLIATLAWLTPINVRHRDYRSAALYLDLPESRAFLEHPPQVDEDSSLRGTVQHRVLEGEAAAPIQDGDTFSIKVNCRSAAGRLVSPISYGLAVTLEIAEPVALNIYDEIRDRIRPRAAITPRRT